MTLHQIFSANKSTLEKAIALADRDDILLLLGDGSYLAHLSIPGISLRVREKDLTGRGLPDNNAQPVTDDEWLQLTLTTDKTLSWF